MPKPDIVFTTARTPLDAGKSSVHLFGPNCKPKGIYWSLRMPDAEAAAFCRIHASHAGLIAKLEKVAAWLDRLADAADECAKTSVRFTSLKEASEADAKNYRATAADIRTALAAALPPAIAASTDALPGDGG